MKKILLILAIALLFIFIGVSFVSAQHFELGFNAYPGISLDSDNFMVVAAVTMDCAYFFPSNFGLGINLVLNITDTGDYDPVVPVIKFFADYDIQIKDSNFCIPLICEAGILFFSEIAIPDDIQVTFITSIGCGIKFIHGNIGFKVVGFVNYILQGGVAIGIESGIIIKF